MKLNIILLFFASTILFSCKRTEEFLYDEETDNVYLGYTNSVDDYVVYTFAYTPGVSKDTIWVPVKIAGKRADHDRKFTIKETPIVITRNDEINAVRGYHYEPFKASYVMPKDSGVVHIPIVVFNAAGLDSQSAFLTFQVSGGDDFKTDLPEKLRTKTITFSNRLEKPLWWDGWQGELGFYSRMKHQLFLISSGTVDIVNVVNNPNAYLDRPKGLFHISNTRYLLNYPFAWVQDNPDKGYVLTKRAGTAEDYDFYNVNTPNIKFHLKFFADANKYVFVDENLNQIIF
ncbi:DUF4843 domain-containing protein [Pedobacter sp. MC2016-14]|uniref:DUF4843 domain-containing protein n=1 Tax=Pedobacter sp. MC2016-14 TaxID=2897327 RepID=UPI001E5F350C|nr:DUF4843 domain-containing protein [Pedobacter sp. MC2016-14]MCD0490486.1 DUF4843 domain-containing protein [Pedobacter sp. MC2016-14]